MCLYSCDQCEKQFCQNTNLSIHKRENFIESLNEFENCHKCKPVDMISRSTDDVKNKNLSITECPETKL